jgi:EAL domain-containing protein (putative c-di-GMP-specific phosphodiesterase class I)/ActR/RegA family two-component response regulator
MTKSDRKPILVSLDDDEQIGEIVRAVGERAGFDVFPTTSAQAFRESLRLNEPAVIVLDLQMPEMDGVQTLRYLADWDVKASIILVTGMDERTIASAEQYGLSRGLRVVATIQKPFTPEEMLEKFLAAKAKAGPLGVAELRKAMELGQLTVHYQPTIQRFADGTWDICAMEALLRWDHPERGLLTPDTFLAMGESHGLSRQLTDFVIQHGMEQMRGWRAHKLDLALRINVSAALITDIDFPDRLGAVLAEQQIEGTALTIELTETGTLEEHADTIDILTRLRLKGINLAIDDFGIGYSSLTQLFRLPFSEMKIDKSLVMRLPASNEARIMVEALVDLAHKLKLSVCAEGVETQQSLDILSAVACDAAQGYLISPPVEAREVPEIVRRWNTRNDEDRAPAHGYSAKRS